MFLSARGERFLDWGCPGVSLGLAVEGWVTLDSLPHLSVPQVPGLQLGPVPWGWTIH